MRVTHILTPHGDRGYLPSPCRPLVTLFYYQLLVNQPHSWFFHFTSNSGMVIPLTYFLSASTRLGTVLGAEDTFLYKTNKVPALKELAFHVERKTMNKINK